MARNTARSLNATANEDAGQTRRDVEHEGRECLPIPGNVKDSAFCRESVQQTVARFGRLDVLVNNAVFQLHAQSLEDITDERLEETFRTNIFGYIYMERAVPATERFNFWQFPAEPGSSNRICVI